MVHRYDDVIIRGHVTKITVSDWLQEVPRRDGSPNPEGVEEGKPSGLFSFNPLSGVKDIIDKLPFIG